MEEQGGGALSLIDIVDDRAVDIDFHGVEFIDGLAFRTTALVSWLATSGLAA